MKQNNFFRYPDGDSTGSDAGKPATDNTKLTTGDTVYVSPDGGTTNEAFPVPGVAYDFCIDVTNQSEMASGAFYVRFTLDNGTGGSGNQTFDFQQEAGLDAGQSVKAVVHFGQFTEDDVNYTLSACIYSPSAPETPIHCAGTFGFNPHTSPHNTDAATSSSDNSIPENSTPENSGTTDSPDTTKTTDSTDTTNTTDTTPGNS